MKFAVAIAPLPSVAVSTTVLLPTVALHKAATVAVTVPPQHQLFEQEEQQQTAKHGRHDPLRVAAFQCMREQLEEHGAQQRAHCEADQR